MKITKEIVFSKYDMQIIKDALLFYGKNKTTFKSKKEYIRLSELYHLIKSNLK